MDNKPNQEFFGRTQRPGQKRPDLLHLFLCLGLTGLFVLLLSTGRLDRVEKIFFDYFLRQRPAVSVSPDILIIDIDNESIQAVGPWPWPWRYHAEMIQILKNAGAKAVLFDFMFKNRPLEEDRAALTRAVSGESPVFLPVSLESKSAKKFWIHSMPVDLEPEAQKTVWIHAPLEIETKAADVGHNNLQTDADGVLRTVPAFLSYAGETHPYLPLAAAYGLKHPGSKMTPASPDLRLPLDEKGRLFINWQGRWQELFARYSYASIVRGAQALQNGMKPAVDMDKIRGKICLVGTTAPGLSRTFATPLEAACPSTAAAAHVLSSALTGKFLRPASFVMNAFYLCVIGFLASLFFVLVRHVSAFFLGIGLGAACLAFSFFIFWRYSVWLYAAQPLFLTLTLFIFSAIYTAIAGSRERSKLFDLATRDGLTGLFVIRHFREIMNQEVVQAQLGRYPLAVILIDIDNFKKINDTYGHPAGDMVLKKVAEMVCTNCRIKRPLNKVDFVARYGGEELIICLKSKLSDAALKVGERIRKAVEQTVFEWEGQKIPVTISLGVGSLHAGENVPDLMVRRADEALYRAKRNGKNQVCIETFAAS